MPTQLRPCPWQTTLRIADPHAQSGNLTFPVQLCRKWILAILCGLAVTVVQAQEIPLAGDALAGKRLALQGGETALRCYSCHGLNGEGVATRDFPHLAGVSELYLRKQLLDYQSGRRVHRLMQPITARMSPQQIADTAAYYASLTPPAPAQPDAGPADLIERGQTLDARGDETKQLLACATCHRPRGTGLSLLIPALAGQPSAYLQAQLQAWKTGFRKNDETGLMAAVAQKLEDGDIDAAARYYSRARPPHIAP